MLYYLVTRSARVKIMLFNRTRCYLLGQLLVRGNGRFSNFNSRRKFATRRIIPIVQRCSCDYVQFRAYHRVRLFEKNSQLLRFNGQPIRTAGSLVRIVKTLLRVRYIVLGGVIGGTITISRSIEGFREKLPDFKWLRDLIPDEDKIKDFEDRWAKRKAKWREMWENTPDWDDAWFADKKASALEWLSDMTKGDAGQMFSAGLLMFNGVQDWDSSSPAPTMPDMAQDVLAAFTGTNSREESSGGGVDHERIEKLQDELMHMQSKYQREMERLEKENKDLRRQLLLKGEKTDGGKRRIRKALIDMYSDVLDLLNVYDSSYSIQDHLPRVVVVGDQSSGKTSVLEMVAQARLFPRGSGEMMTRSPVKVTLSEGPYHVAKFRDSQREFDLSKDSECAELRREIEMRMKNSVQNGKTVSHDVISLTVKGPGLPRMVLVDLPGVISTVTADMARETREDIVKMCRTYMENPNAIILCIQDGSVDAERSNVTDLVASMDPQGKRTILVLTKVDLAEETLMNPDRIKKILEGKLFPMKALGYYAVVTGRGNSNDSIESIRKYEEQFFGTSKLFRDGVLKPSQMTTQNMSLAVSDCFWKMVKESIEQQADAFKATRFNLETEWKNNFPRQRELDRDELFERARGEILDEIINLSQITAKQWEEKLQQKLWDRVSNYVFENIYIPAALADSLGAFNTLVDIKLKHWADNMLPKKCVEVGWETVQDEFGRLVEQDSKTKDHDPIFDPLKLAVIDHAMKQHVWEKKAADYLRVIQLNALEDRSVSDRTAWDNTIAFMQQAIKQRLDQTKNLLEELKGPGWVRQWTRWQSPTDVQRQRQAAEGELKRVLSSDPQHKPTLLPDEITVTRRNLQAKGIEVDTEFIREVWHQLYRLHFLQRALSTTHECRNFYYYYQKGFSDNEVDCNAVVLFWRVQRMLQITANALRQQITNTEARRLEKEIKEALEEWSQEPSIKQQLLTGRRVNLAEELKQVRLIQEKLEEFIQALNQEKSV